VPHAILIAGPAGIGKRAFALALAKRLLCESPSGELGCDACPACRWFMGGNHPDFRWVVSAAAAEAEAVTESEPGEGKKKASHQIRIEQIRELADFVYQSGHRGQARVVIIDPADAMNAAAANSLLKMLEEPPESVHFLLISSHWRRLLPTIRSRCRLLMLPRPASSLANSWLETQEAGAHQLLSLMGGAPLLALAEVERIKMWTNLMDSLSTPGSDPIALAVRWESGLKEGQSMESLIALIQKKVFDLICQRMGGQPRFMNVADKGAGRRIMGLNRCYDELLRMRALASHPLNAKLFLEDVAARYIKAFA